MASSLIVKTLAGYSIGSGCFVVPFKTVTKKTTKTT